MLGSSRMHRHTHTHTTDTDGDRDRDTNTDTDIDTDVAQVRCAMCVEGGRDEWHASNFSLLPSLLFWSLPLSRMPRAGRC